MRQLQVVYLMYNWNTRRARDKAESFLQKKLLIIWKALRHSMTDSGSSENAKHKRMPVKTIFSHIIFQLHKTKNNEKILKESRERTRKTTYRGTIKRITVEFSQEPFKQEEISETLKVV